MIIALNAYSVDFVEALSPVWTVLNTNAGGDDVFAIAYAIAKGTPEETSILLGNSPPQSAFGTLHWMFITYRGAGSVVMPYLVQTQNSPGSYMFPAQPIPRAALISG